MNFLRRLASRFFFLPAMRPPLISIIGATGTGKSQLAVELALSLNGEVINADAMQLYRGLPIITNKITPEERRGVPHHLLGCLDTAETWQVGRFVREAESTIEDISSRGKLPIVVGGTHYYIQSLLFPHSLGAEGESNTGDVDPDLAKKYPILDAPTPELYTALQRVDPAMSARWHPNDRRKIRRSLEIYYSTGCRRTASQVYAAQRAATSPARSKYRNLVFWVHFDASALRTRLDSRVDRMLETGMWEEVLEMHRIYRRLDGAAGGVDLNTGIWQSIGFKEFLPCLEDDGGDEARGEEVKEKAVDEMKTATRQYARQQVRWVRIKFLNALRARGTDDSIYLLDSSDVPHYNRNVTEPAIRIARAFLEGEEGLPDPLALGELAKENLTAKREYDMGQRPDLWVQRRCEVCGVVTTNVPDWEMHTGSSKHKKRIAGRKKKLEVEELLRRREEMRLRGGGEEVGEATMETKKDWDGT